MAAGDIVVISEEAGGRKGNYFDGTDDYVLHDAHAVARVAAGDTVGTYTAWIYIEEIGTDECILSAGDNNSATEYLQFYVSSTGALKVKLHHGAADQFKIYSTNAITAKQWTHVAIVQNGTQPMLYINGVAQTNNNEISLDLTAWYNVLTLVDKFAIGVLEINATHIGDFKGAIGQVRYWSTNLGAHEILAYYKSENGHYNSTKLTAALGSARETVLNAALQFNITMDQDGITDAGLGLDDGTLTGHAFYGGYISDWSYHLQFDGHITGHAAEDVETFIDGSKYVTVIRRGD